MSCPAILVLEEGSLFEGVAFGHLSQLPTHAVGEVVFNTAMTGYQEILTDPSYANQLVTLTYPHIGNVGVNNEDEESPAIHAKGLIIRQLPFRQSNWRATQSLESYLCERETLGIAEIDTRRLTRLIREKGALRGCIYAAPTITEAIKAQAHQLACQSPSLQGLDLAKEVTIKAPMLWNEKGVWPYEEAAPTRFHVVAYDFGIKKTILRCLKNIGCKITIVPATTSAADVLALSPDGVFLSNGPGDPEPCGYAISAIKHLLAVGMPLFGICLGHQLLALACGAKSIKMKFGHHGGNHPVRCLKSKQVLITSQNHGFTVDEASMPEELEVTHRSLFDNTLQGLKHRFKPAFGFQGHPEAGPGPNDARAIFQDFILAMSSQRETKKTTTTSLEMS